MIFSALELLVDIIFVIPELVGVKTPIAGLGTSVDAANGAVCGGIRFDCGEFGVAAKVTAADLLFFISFIYSCWAVLALFWLVRYDWVVGSQWMDSFGSCPRNILGGWTGGGG